MMYLIIVCQNCGRLLIANSNQKTRTCPYCQKRITVFKAIKVAKARTAREASIIVQKLKRKET
ncbi:hypothetical protein DRO54_02235 [Candidatus Bathyarchaeota archaeon]|nr:MAG: hypothetical protein DRO54_02235 [Candidatus Bathyarchaeota archaeon]